MRHLQIGRKLGVSSPHRIALLRSLTLALIEKESIKTTVARAKELRWYADRVVTLAKRGDVSARRHIVKLLGSTETKVPGQNRVRLAIDRIYTDLVPRFQTRPGGYTSIIRLDTRRVGDNAELCVIRYIPGPESKGGKPAPKAKKAKTESKEEKEPKKKLEASAKGAKAEDKSAKASKKKEKEKA